MREYLQRALQRVGYEVEAVGCGTEAMPLLESQHFDLLLTDIVMASQPHLIARVQSKLVESLNGFTELPVDGDYVRAPALGNDAGPLGAIALAMNALA